MQLTLDFSLLKEKVPEPAGYRHPMEDFRAMAIAYGVIDGNDDMGVVRKICLERGLGKAGWRFLNRYGEKAYAAVIPATEDDKERFDIALYFVAWQCCGGLKEPLAVELGERFISCLFDAFILERDIDPRIARLANDHIKQLAGPAERETFAHEEWVHLLIWMRDEQPRFDRNQWRAGWGTIRRRYQKWKMANMGRISWQSILPPFDQDGLHVQPLTSSYELAEEGGRMKNCVGTYTSQCIAGDYRLFSITEAESGRPLATASIQRKGDYWKIDQVKGKFNRTPVTRAARLGRVILEKYCREEEMIAWRKRQEHQQSIEALRAEHEAYLCKRQDLPEEFKALFSAAEIEFLENRSAWLSALVAGQLQPNACEQVRFIAVMKGILTPRTANEKTWKRFQVLSNS
ncbi:MAG: macrodomain Ori organization protein MaoP [Xanthomonadales bacterium]|nr:DUF413 domain-containing protein [Gammaproteobacteria bacterium]NNK05118.1 macrodomain Ori organization protein MaoP [Xanthomonadales bacterium]